MTVTVFTQPRCVQCDATKRRLTRDGVPFTVVDITQDVAARDHVLGLGYQQVPVVEHEGGHWSGYRPDRLAGLITQKGAA